MSNKLYFALIADIKSSKKITDRNTVQKKLENVLQDINYKYKNDIYSKFTITLGDEFQALLKSGANIMNIITEIERRMYPTKFRFGIGIGEISTDVNRELSIGADGPAYHLARRAIVYIKADEKKKQTNAPFARVEFDVNKDMALLLNTVLSLLTVIKDEWTDRQRDIIWDMLEHQDSQINVAQRLNIKQPTVQKSLSKGKYYAFKNALDTIDKVLGEIGYV